MAWFIIASIVGLAAYFVWRGLYPFLTTRAVIACAAVVAVVVIIGLLVVSPGAIRNVVLQIDDGTFARLLLGFILGAGVGYATDQPAVSAAVWLPLGAAILLLAIIAPHVDAWMTRLTG